MTAALVLGVIDKWLALRLMRLQNMTPEHAAEYWERTEERTERLWALYDRIHGDAPDPPTNA